MIRLLLADLVVLAAGNGVVVLVAGPARAALGVAARLAVSFLLGIAVLGLVTTVLAATHLPTTLPVTAPALLLLAHAGLRGAHRPRLPRDVAWPRVVARAVPYGLAAAVTARVAVAAVTIPVQENDEFAIWAVRARLLSLAGRFDPDIGFGVAGGYQHADYPLALPGLVAWSDSWAGYPHDGAAHLQVVLTFAAMLTVGGWLGARYAGALGGSAAVLLLGGLERVLPRYGFFLFADVPVAAFAVAGVAVALVWLDDGADRLLGLVGALGAGAALTKNEGALVAVALVAGVLAAGARRGGSRRWRAAAGVTPLVAMLPWWVFTRANGITSDIANSDVLSPGGLLAKLDTLGRVVSGMAGRWPGLDGLALVLPFAALLLALARGRGRHVLLLATFLAVDVAGLVVVYLGEINHVPSSAHRTLLAPAAVLAVCAPVLAGTARPRGAA